MQCIQIPEVMDPPGVEVEGSCELPDVDSRNQTQAECKTSVCITMSYCSTLHWVFLYKTKEPKCTKGYMQPSLKLHLQSMVVRLS